jgi:GDP-mannose 6-dehydrogenase
MVENLTDVLDHGQLIVVGNNDPAFHCLPSRLKPGQYLIDMVRIPGTECLAGRYDGINW